jgi:hypothetical protein
MTLNRATSKTKPTTNTEINIRKIVIGAPRVTEHESQSEYRRDTSSNLGSSCADLCVPRTSYLSPAFSPGMGGPPMQATRMVRSRRRQGTILTLDLQKVELIRRLFGRRRGVSVRAAPIPLIVWRS